MAKRKTKVREFGSPIEVRLRNALLGAAVASGDLTFLDFSTSVVPTKLIVGSPHEIDGPQEDDVDDRYLTWGDGRFHFCLYGNVVIGSYRADLLVEDIYDNFTAIECDGHDWHERTKQQASADRARDRALLRLGIPTLRFTGSDIVYNDHACATEILEIVLGIRDRAEAAEGHALDIHERGFAAGARRAAENARIDEQARASRGIFRGIITELG